MIGAFLTLLVCIAAISAAWTWWRSVLNPVFIGAIMWTPALIMLNFPPNFLSAIYIHLNMPISGFVYIVLAVAFASFWLGCLVVKTLAPEGSFDLQEHRVLSNFSPFKAFLLFSVGLMIFVYSYLQSGLTDLADLDAQQVAESRLSLHLGLVSFLTLFMDIASIALFGFYIRTGRRIFLVPLLITFMAYASSLQKSSLVWLVAGAAFVCAIQPTQSKRLLWSSVPVRMLLFGLAISFVIVLFLVNDVRGMSDVQMTAASSPWIEQFYIYSGASALMNISVSIDHYMPSPPQTWGQMMLRPIFWLAMNAEDFQVTQYFEGVNTGSYLIYGWSDFRWAGFAIFPFVSGILSMIYLRVALRGSMLGLVFGGLLLRALIFSPSSDILFEPTTTITLVLAAVASFACQLYYRTPTAYSAIYPTARPPFSSRSSEPGQPAG